MFISKEGGGMIAMAEFHADARVSRGNNHSNPSYHRPLNNFRRMRSRYDTRSRFTALLDEIQGVVRGVD